MLVDPAPVPVHSSGRVDRMSAMTALIGGTVCLGGAILAVTTAGYWASIQPPGVTIGPPTFVQSLQFHIEEGAYTALFGFVLMMGGVIAGRAARRSSERTNPAPSFVRRRRALLAAALVMTLAVALFGLAPTPQRTVSLGPNDFQLAPAGADGPFEIYLVSHGFPAAAGEDFLPWIGVDLRDNATGSVLAYDGFNSSYVKAESAPYAVPQFGGEFLAAATTVYVVVVRSSICESLGSAPCANGTLRATGSVTITTPLAFLAWQLGLGIAGSSCVIAAVVQSGIGRRRTTS